MTDKPENNKAQIEDLTDAEVDVEVLAGGKPEESKFRMVDNRRVYRTATGMDVTILGISPLLIQRVGDAFRAKNPEPLPPTYTVTTAGGGEELHYHEESTVETTEEIAAFEEYKKAHEEWRKLEQRSVVRAVAIKGVKYEMPEDEEWIETQKLLGLEDDIPDDPLGRKIHYFETEVIGSVEDMLTLLGSAMGIGGLQDKMLDSALRLFPAEV